jgi:excinuclease ABC subunit A
MLAVSVGPIMPAQHIKIVGARQHNLKNLSVEIPREKLVVITGLSGSGKSSLAFDTLFAEGQRKYVESLSAYARQFLDQMQKPDVDYIEGLSPAIAIEQRFTSGNPRSTIATTTEIYDYLRLLYAAIGQPHDPATGEPVSKQSPQQIIDEIAAWPESTRIMLLAPMIRDEVGEFRDVIEKLRREGFVRARIDGDIVELERPEPIRVDKTKKHRIEAVVDRLVIRDGIRPRLADSVETALRWGQNRLVTLFSKNDFWTERRFSTDYGNPETGFTLGELTPKHFSFNSHLGACPVCHGLGTEQVFDPDLMIPDPSKSLSEGAVAPWAKSPKRMRGYYDGILESLARAFGVSVGTPYADLPDRFKEALAYGTDTREIEFTWKTAAKTTRSKKPFEGLVPLMQRLYERTESEFTRRRLRLYTGRQECATCRGLRLRPEILAVTLADRSGQLAGIHAVCAMTVGKAKAFIDSLALTDPQREIVHEVAREILARLRFLEEVGLGYLTLDRESGSLSGGEAQRIRLATQIGSGLAGVMYVLDEPSIGLHQRDNDRLITTLRRLRDLGNSVIVVEHDEDTIREADHIIDLGPGAGPRGGEVIAEGSVDDLIAADRSLTGHYLGGRLEIPVPKRRVEPIAGQMLFVRGAAENNLKSIDVRFPLGCFTCVTGVSGSGKSTLVDDILRRALFRHFYGSKDRPGRHTGIYGLEMIDNPIVIDQSPIGRTPRSNPVTYTGALTPIRQLFSQLPSARIRGYDSGRFSFNVKGGRCENCQGDGVIRIEMHFLPDVYVECEVCRGRRYNRETLEITYKGKNIADVLDMTVDEGERFFRNVPAIADKLDSLKGVGLGYVRLGQSATTLSGGEAQRVKLATELAKKATGRTVYILDEPTTGLHFADIHTLLEVLMKLRNAGNTLIVIEHNLEVIKCADWLIDLGPEGGEAGGQIVAEGTPEMIAALDASHTGRYLKKVLARK